MKARILVVDDEEQIRASLEEILKIEGYDVRLAGNGEEAITALQEETFDLILLDLKMPGMDGMEVMRNAGQLAPDTQVILMTGHGTIESAIEALRHGVHDYLMKPAPSRDILNSVARALSRRVEQQQRRFLLEQLDASVQRLKTVEGIEALPPAETQAIQLEDGVTIDLTRREIWRGNQRVLLTPTEGKLMKVLLEYRGRVLSHRELVFQVQGYDTTDWEAPEVLRPLISRLRRKLSAFPNGEKWIVNVRGTGYVFEWKGDNSESANKDQ